MVKDYWTYLIQVCDQYFGTKLGQGIWKVDRKADPAIFRTKFLFQYVIWPKVSISKEKAGISR
jgi:hypothetical protein